MTRKEKIQELLARLNAVEESRDFPTSIDNLLSKEAASTQAIRRITDELVKVKKDPRIKQMAEKLQKLEVENDDRRSGLSDTFSEQIAGLVEEVRASEAKGTQMTQNGIKAMLSRLENYKTEYEKGIKDTSAKSTALEVEVRKLSDDLSKVPDSFDGTFLEISNSLAENIVATDEAMKTAVAAEVLIKETEQKLNNRISQIQTGGGNANRSILVGGNKDTLKYFTDINLKAGTNVTITTSVNQATKYTDITIAAAGGGSSTRSVNTISSDTSAGSSTGTDYVYICSAALTLTLPTAASNSNLYTVKNNTSGVVIINPSGSDTIDSDATLQLVTRYTSVDLVSDGVSNWNIT
jgi:hypothetical protein